MKLQMISSHVAARARTQAIWRVRRLPAQGVTAGLLDLGGISW
jgi:hypothetical protein